MCILRGSLILRLVFDAVGWELGSELRERKDVERAVRQIPKTMSRWFISFAMGKL